MLQLLELTPGRYPSFFYKFKAAMKDFVPFKYKEIFKIMETKSKQKPYMGYPAENQKVLVTGAGPIGLRTAIESQFLGAETVVIEKREEFTRHNILKLWKFLVTDFKSLGAKKFLGQFCSGSINHIGIRNLQLFLVKVCLFIGVKIVCPATLVNLKEPENGVGWRAELIGANAEQLADYEFNMVVIASGKKVPIEGFNRRSLDAKLSIAVTANFKNTGTREEAMVITYYIKSTLKYMKFLLGESNQWNQ